MIMKIHPDETALRKVSQLTPALRELVARMARAAAKDAIGEVMEAQGLVFRAEVHALADAAVGATFDLVAEQYGSAEMKLTDEQRKRAQSHVDRLFEKLSEPKEDPWYAKGLRPEQVQSVTDGIDYVKNLEEGGR